MELEHSFTVPVPLDQAWNVLLDVERVAPCMPGATLDKVDGDEIHGKIKVKVGPINMTYAGTARFVEVNQAEGVVKLEASGKETRGAGTASATVRSELKDQGGQTHVVVLTTLNVTGKPAQFGRGVMNEVGGRLLNIFAENLAATLAEATPESPPAAPAAPAADLTTSVSDLGLSPRAAASLNREGIATVGDLAGKSGDELLTIDGIGPATIDDIRAKLDDIGLMLGQAPVPAQAAGPAPETAAAAAPAVSAETPAAHKAEEKPIDLIKVAGMPVLKRAIPVLVAVVAAVFVGIRRKLRRRARARAR